MAAPIRTITTPHSPPTHTPAHTLTPQAAAAVMQLLTLRRRSPPTPLSLLPLSSSLTSTDPHLPRWQEASARVRPSPVSPGDEGYLKMLQERVALKMKGKVCVFWMRAALMLDALSFILCSFFLSL